MKGAADGLMPQHSADFSRMFGMLCVRLDDAATFVSSVDAATFVSSVDAATFVSSVDAATFRPE
jgi:hypothetical protein